MEDERLSTITSEKETAINNANTTYSNLLSDSEDLYNQQLEYANTYQTTQDQLADESLAYQLEQIEQAKEEARENAATESKKAKNDYASYVNPYGVNAETMASNGLLNTGLSETSQLGAWNTYQNRLSSANKVLQDAITAYDDEIQEARLSNDATKAETALAKLQMQLEYAETYYSNKSNITTEQLNTVQALDDDYFNRYQTMYENIKNEEATAEAIRQWEAELAEEQRQYDLSLAEEQRQYNESLNYSYATNSSSSSSSSTTLSDSSSSGTTLTGSDLYSLVGTETSDGNTITVNPYTGDLNEDVQYGVFSNGYQPNNVGGVKLQNSGYKVGDVYVNAVGSTGISLANQSIWQAGGHYYVWDGSINDYVDVTDDVKAQTTSKSGVKISWGVVSG